MVRGQGADEVFDYAAPPENVMTLLGGRRYDMIIDFAATTTLRQLKGALTKNGGIVILGSAHGSRVLGITSTFMRSAFGSHPVGVKVTSMFAKTNASDHASAAGWLRDGTLTPVVQAKYLLADAAAACTELERSHVAGKLVITVG